MGTFQNGTTSLGRVPILKVTQTRKETKYRMLAMVMDFYLQIMRKTDESLDQNTLSRINIRRQ